MTDQKIDFEKVMAERFAQLPASVQQAITSADVEAHLRALADQHKLHLDQWNLLENEVMLTLLGLERASELKENIMKEVGVSDEVATALAVDIARHIFQPIRDDLERRLEHPEAAPEAVSDVDAVRAQMLSDTAAPPAPPTAVQPATPPASPPDQKVARTDASATYLSSTPSHERKAIEGDPYREQVN